MKKLWQKSEYQLDPVVEAFETKGDLLMDQKLLKYDVQGSVAHAKMLYKIGILSKEELKKLQKAFKEILSLDKAGKFNLEIGDEDIHTKIENYITYKYGEVGKKIHTGRSRNDQVLTAIRLLSKSELKKIEDELIGLTKQFNLFAKKYGDIPIPGYTHMQKAISLAKKFGNRLHICHVSLKKEIELIKKAKKNGLQITCEVTCHHLFLTEEDAKRLGPFGVMRPPLASKDDQAALWEAIQDGTIDMIASDHAPHTKEEKLSEKVPSGVPGLETTLPLLLTAVSDGRLGLERLIELTSANPGRIFHLPEQQDTFTEIEFTKPYTLIPKPLHTKCGWTPFAGMKVKGKVKKVVLRGQLAYDGQTIFGPYGKVIDLN